VCARDIERTWHNGVREIARADHSRTRRRPVPVALSRQVGGGIRAHGEREREAEGRDPFARRGFFRTDDVALREVVVAMGHQRDR